MTALVIQVLKVVESGKLFFLSTSSKFSDFDSTRSNNTTSNLEHAITESELTLKYRAPATLTQKLNNKYGCGVEVSKTQQVSITPK